MTVGGTGALNELIHHRIILWTVCLRLWIKGDNTVNNAQFLHRPIILLPYDLNMLLGATGVNIVFLDMLF